MSTPKQLTGRQVWDPVLLDWDDGYSFSDVRLSDLFALGIYVSLTDTAVGGDNSPGAQRIRALIAYEGAEQLLKQRTNLHAKAAAEAAEIEG